MNITINPFQQLYFSDDVQSEEAFVELFSAEVLQTAINPVFQGANVVLSGTQGCGKTMILSLLRPETRLAYWKQEKKFPVNEQMCKFISAGINLTRSRITDIVEVTLHKGDEIDEREMPFYFADSFNYLVVEDVIKSIETIGRHSKVFDSIVDLSHIEKFVRLFAAEDCWFGALKNARSLKELKSRIHERVVYYRSWVNGNLEELQPQEKIRRSKTNIGEPIARAAECLRQSGVIANDVPVLIRVDQIETMHRANAGRRQRLLLAFRTMLNCVFAARDARVHYRAGSRRYGWDNPDYLRVWGSGGNLEARRDYLMIDMDEELFVRKEKANTIFDRFALDAFEKRAFYFYRGEVEKLAPDFAKTVFGKSPTAEERLKQLKVSPNVQQIDRALALDAAEDRGDWSNEWRSFLREMYRTSHAGMLNAALAAAWGRQTGGGNLKHQHRESPPPKDTPWKERKWWRKERLDHAVLQLSTRCQQRFMWWGFQDICSLSGGNITAFLHISHRIWDGFLKWQSSQPKAKRVNLFDGGEINNGIQDAGILFASNDWFKKFPEEPGGNTRQRFVELLGRALNGKMLNDFSMSYPGGNGVSITKAEYEDEGAEVTIVRQFLQEGVGFGVLFAIEHTSKSKSEGRRIKFYLHPLLCPRFQLPEARTKEPYYWKIGELISLASKAGLPISTEKQTTSTKADLQQSLFTDSGGGIP